MIGYKPFASLAKGYRERGFSPLPILCGKKIPGYGGPGHPGIPMSDWGRHCETPMTLAEIDRIAFMDPRAGVGLACGCGGLIAVDVDNEKAYAAVREVFAGIHPPSKRGMKGATAFFRGQGIASRKFLEKMDPVTRKRPTLVEFLAAGNQTVIPPTMHPDTGKPYRWVYGSLEEVNSPSELPVLTQAMIDELALALGPFMEVKQIAEPVAVRSATDLADLERRRYEGFARKALENEAANLAATHKPGRNRALFRGACLLGKYAMHGIMPARAIADAFKDACECNGLVKENGLKDVMKTIQAGFNYARNDPLPQLQERLR